MYGWPDTVRCSSKKYYCNWNDTRMNGNDPARQRCLILPYSDLALSRGAVARGGCTGGSDSG